MSGCAAKSSVRSAMFIATRAARCAKLRRSGMAGRSLGHGRRSVGARIPIHAAPPELGRVCGVGVAIDMALLTELDVLPAPKICAKYRASAARHRFGLAWNDRGAFTAKRKRRRRCALPAHSKACGATADTSALEREIDQQVYALYLPAPSLRQAGGLTPEEIKIVESASVQTSARPGSAAK